jgi:hypothetical protein
MVLVKTQAGQDAMKDRHGGLSSRQRSAFILFDGKRTMGEVLAATAAMGITQEDVQTMIAQGLLASAGGGPLPSAPESPAAPAAAAAAADPAASETARPSQQRYKDAYPVATAMTAALGLRGFRLNLAVESASSFEDLAALAPKIKEAVGEAKYEPLRKALFG